MKAAAAHCCASGRAVAIWQCSTMVCAVHAVHAVCAVPTLPHCCAAHTATLPVMCTLCCAHRGWPRCLRQSGGCRKTGGPCGCSHPAGTPTPAAGSSSRRRAAVAAAVGTPGQASSPARRHVPAPCTITINIPNTTACSLPWQSRRPSSLPPHSACRTRRGRTCSGCAGSGRALHRGTETARGRGTRAEAEVGKVLRWAGLVGAVQEAAEHCGSRRGRVQRDLCGRGEAAEGRSG